MADFGHVKRITESVGGREITFRSKLEYRWCQWLQFQKEQGLIKEWWYEDPDSLLELTKPIFGNIIHYLPDFTVETNLGDFEYHETKGWFTPKDATKMRLAAQKYENKFTLIFANLTHCKSSRAQRRRAEKLECWLERVIYTATKDIFNRIGIK